jgi:hypothetical protein
VPVLGAAAFNLVVTNHAAGARNAIGAAALHETITFTAAGTRTTFGSATEHLVFTVATTGNAVFHDAAHFTLHLALNSSGVVTPSSYPAGPVGFISDTSEGNLVETLSGRLAEAREGSLVG